MVKLVYTKTSSGRKKPSKSKRLEQAREEHAKFLKKMGLPAKVKAETPNKIPNYKNDERGAPLSNNIPAGVAPKRDIQTDHLWRKGAEESADTIKEIKRKAANIAPAYNKGPAMYLPFKPEDAKKQ